MDSGKTMNVKMFTGKLAEKHYPLVDFANELGMSYTTLRRILNDGGAKFPVEGVVIATRLLDLTTMDILKMFMPDVLNIHVRERGEIE